MLLDLPILDNHMHLDPNGLGVDAAKKFQDAGGTHIVLVDKPYHHIPRGEYELQFRTTLDLAEKVRKETGLTVFTALCPHPAELTGFLGTFTLEQAKEKLIQGIDLAATYIEKGEVLCFGESGRPHYQVQPDVWEASNDLIRYTLERAKELDCAVQFHTESGERSFIDIAEIATSIGFPLERCVKHFSGPDVLPGENHGLIPSVVSRRGSIKKAIPKGNRYLMETDYLDELTRPDVVLPPHTVPSLTLRFLKSGRFSEEDVLMIHKELPERVYGIEMELD
jgi:TatD-related deoxyribonuclease